jgi:DNA-binding MarR family transcriptional regulator
MSDMPQRLVPALQRAVHATAVLLEPVLRELGLTLAEANVLAQLAAAGPATIGHLHRAFGHRRSTLTSILDRLEARGHVRRELESGDRRTFRIVPTPSGTRSGRRILRELDALERDATDGLRPSDVAGFWKVLESLQRRR